MLNLNEAPKKQTAAGAGTIPPHSIVIVRLSIVRPQSGMAGDEPLLTRRRSGIQQLCCNLTVTEGSFKDKVIYHNFNLAGAQNQGQHRAVQISMAQLRAAVEFARGITPDDASPQAAEKRRVELADLEGMTFPVVVDCEASSQVSKSDPTKYYVNNIVHRVVTLRDPECAELKERREIISQEPIPDYPAAAAPQASAPAWAAPAAQQTPPPAQAPAWQNQPAAPQPAPAQAWQTPATNNNTDTVPF